MGNNDDLNPDLFDCDKLFPENVGKSNLKVIDPELQRWLSKSSFTCSIVGLSSKIWLKCLSSAQIYNRDVLINALENRPPGVPLLTVANHHSCADEPLLWGILDVRHLLNQRLMRWSLAAHDICFTQRFHASFFSLGKSIPIVRGIGVYQQGMTFALDRINEGNWLHLFPEGKVNEVKTEMRLKWGVGRLISDAKVAPIVIPIYHQGMDSILPNRTPYWPRMFQKVTVVVGNPIKLDLVLEDLRSRGATAEEQRKVITDLVQTHLYKLRVISEVLHARHVSGGWFNRSVPGAEVDLS